MSTPTKHRVILVIPSVVVARGIKDLLSEYREFELVGTLPDFSQFSARMITLTPDIVIIDPAVFDFSKRLSIRSNFPHLSNCILLAITGICLEEEAAKHYDGILNLCDSQVQLIGKLRRAAESGKHDTDNAEIDEISQREREILIAVAKGKTNKEIARMHNISVYTVISHRKNISRKIGIKTVAGLTVYAMLNNLIDQTDI